MQEFVKRALNSDDAARAYFNSALPVASSSDMLIILGCNNDTVALLNCSYESAKLLAKQLTEAIIAVETQVGVEFLTAEDMTP